MPPLLAWRRRTPTPCLTTPRQQLFRPPNTRVLFTMYLTLGPSFSSPRGKRSSTCLQRWPAGSRGHPLLLGCAMDELLSARRKARPLSRQADAPGPFPAVLTSQAGMIDSAEKMEDGSVIYLDTLFFSGYFVHVNAPG